MQIMIETGTDSAKELELVGYLLLELSDFKNGIVPHESNDDGEVELAASSVPPPPLTAPISVDDDGEFAAELRDVEIQAAPAIAPPPPPRVPGSTAVEYDSAGIPWDARIHQEGRAQKLDNTWKLRKRLDPAVVKTVMAELALRCKVPTGTMSAADHAPLALPIVSAIAPPPPLSVTVPPPPTNGAPPPPVANSVLPSNGPVTFKELVTIVLKAMEDKTLTKEQLDAGLMSVGLGANQLGLLASQPQLVPSMAAYVNGIIQ